MTDSLTKNTFWSKVRSGTSKISSLSTSLGNLSLRTEHDGDSINSTLIHKALVKHYRETGQSYPEWLGVSPDEEPPQESKSFLRPQQFKRRERNEPQSTGASSVDSAKPRRPAASTSFKDIYVRSSPAQSDQTQQQSSQPPQLQSHPSFGQYGHSRWGSSLQKIESNDRQGSSHMRDRLKKTSYNRTNFV